MSLRTELEQREQELLANYAVLSCDSQGRVHPQSEASYRLCFQRDRDRIIHSTAFRRLEYKTQVFVNHVGDHNRTRLTHTIEVAQIARTIARTLRLNEDLTEAIALAHDLGHTPFGHTGERVLNKLMREDGGFEHNRQGLRVVDLLEYVYPDFRGLNLSYEVREAILKRHNPYADHPFQPKSGQLTLEAQIVDLADKIAYNSHDLDDGLNNKMLTSKELHNIALWKENLEKASRSYQRASARKLEKIAVKLIISQQVDEVIRTTIDNLQRHQITSVEQVRDFKQPLVRMSEEAEEKDRELRNFLHQHMYEHYRIIRMSHKATQFMTSLFDAFINNPRLLPPSFQRQAKEESLKRVVADYIAGMTDRYALDEYIKIFNPYER